MPYNLIITVYLTSLGALLSYQYYPINIKVKSQFLLYIVYQCIIIVLWAQSPKTSCNLFSIQVNVPISLRNTCLLHVGSPASHMRYMCDHYCLFWSYYLTSAISLPMSLNTQSHYVICCNYGTSLCTLFFI